jgi:hypothetical protein
VQRDQAERDQEQARMEVAEAAAEEEGEERQQQRA